MFATVDLAQSPGGTGTDRLRQMDRARCFFDLAVPRDCFLAAGLRIAPNGMAAAFANQNAAML